MTAMPSPQVDTTDGKLYGSHEAMGPLDTIIGPGARLLLAKSDRSILAPNQDILRRHADMVIGRPSKELGLTSSPQR